MPTRLELFVSAVETELNDATVEFVIGKGKEGRHSQRRRVHWYRDGGQIESHTRAGGPIEGTGQSQAGDEAEGSRAPAVWQRVERIECVIFAETDESAEVLLDNLIVAIDHARPNGGIEFQEYTWQENEIAQRVPLCRLSLVASLPVRDEIKQMVEITAETHNCEWDIP